MDGTKIARQRTDGELHWRHKNNLPKAGELNGRHKDKSPKGWRGQK